MLGRASFPSNCGVMEEPLRAEAAKGTLFEQTLRRMVLGAVAWKLRGGEWRGRKDCEVCQLEELEKDTVLRACGLQKSGWNAEQLSGSPMWKAV